MIAGGAGVAVAARLSRIVAFERLLLISVPSYLHGTVQVLHVKPRPIGPEELGPVRLLCCCGRSCKALECSENEDDRS